MAGCDVTKGGHCDPNGTCLAGWTGADCKQRCLKGFYGKNCELRCSVCENHDCSCDPVTGACSPACLVTLESKANAYGQLVIPSVVGASVIALLALFVVGYVWRHRDDSENETLQNLDGVATFWRRYSQSPHLLLGTYSPEGAKLHRMSILSHLSSSSLNRPLPLDGRSSPMSTHSRRSRTGSVFSSFDEDLFDEDLFDEDLFDGLSENDTCVESITESEQSERKCTEQSGEKCTEQSGGKSTEQSGGKCTEQSGGKSTEQSGEKCTEQSGGKSTEQIEQKPTEAVPIVPRLTCTSTTINV
ncbi:hypothetical protein BaRGS_00021849 [Batillaria attramentaria]|uniref:EGF-like domain-containing protein n=1 Tax=Batillaria attramentaria TaxID=370345 RepID=A0ABD0KI28_9CAEN